MADVEIQSLVAIEDATFEGMRAAAVKEGRVLRYVASLENGKAKAALQRIGPEHPFYSISGNDNVIAFTTSRYLKNPVVVRGPGAGAEVTAAGVFADILRLVLN
jgi:aspartokinase/homoserine dehydrogenase 1